MINLDNTYHWFVDREEAGVRVPLVEPINGVLQVADADFETFSENKKALILRLDFAAPHIA